MSEITEPRELFIHELRDILGAEQAVERILGQVEREIQDESLTRRLADHVGETRQHIANLERVFRQLGEEPTPGEGPSIEGLHREHQATTGKVAEQLRDTVAVASQVKIESYEIAAYRTLVDTARALGEIDVASVLEENLEQERAMLADLEANVRRLAQGQRATWGLAPDSPQVQPGGGG